METTIKGLQKCKLTKTAVENAPAIDRRYHLYDTEIPGFSVKIEPSGSKIYVFDYRAGAGGRGAAKKRITIGKAGPLTPEQARTKARELYAQVTLGEDPGDRRKAERGKTFFKHVAERYLKEYIAHHNKPSTVKGKNWNIYGSIMPHFRHMNVEDITRKDIQEWHGKLHETPSNANRALATLSHIMTVCEDWGLRNPNTNPCLGIKRYRENKRDRYLNEDELRRLVNVLNECERDGLEDKNMMIFFRMLIFTGARQGELLTAKWDYVNREEMALELPDSKTGKKKINLSAEALAEIDKLVRVVGNPYLFPGYFKDVQEKLGRHHSPPNEMWKRILKRAGIENFRKHDLRHAYASFAIMAGLTLEEIGQLLGHLTPQTTKRYSHLIDSHRKKIAGTVGTKIAAIIKGGPDKVVPIGKGKKKSENS